VARGTEVIVHFAANNHVCRIELPPMGPTVDPGITSTQAVDDLVAELVPSSVRGKELRRFWQAFGLPSVSTVEFENVSISEFFQGQERTKVTIAFTNEVCKDQVTR